MAGRSRNTRRRKKSAPAWHQRLDRPTTLLLALVLGAFLLPQRTTLESAWYQLTAPFHPAPREAAPWLLVEIDGQSRKQLGDWPWDQHQFRLIVEHLQAMEPAAVVVLQQPPTPWSREGIALLRHLEQQLEPSTLQALHRELDNPDALYRLPGLYYASLPGAGPTDWPEGLIRQPVEDATRWQARLHTLLATLQGYAPDLKQGGHLLARPAALVQAPLLRTDFPGQAHRPAWFELDDQLTPSLAVRLLMLNKGVSWSETRMQPGKISLGKQHWQVEFGGRYWPSLQPDNLPTISLHTLLNDEVDVQGRWLLLAPSGTPFSRDERLEAFGSASLHQRNHSITPWFALPAQALLLVLLTLFLAHRGPALAHASLLLGLAALMILHLVTAQVLQGWLHWWIQPAWPALAMGILGASHWLRFSTFTPLRRQALHNTRLQLAQSLLEQQRWQDSLKQLRKLPANTARLRLLQRFHQAAVAAGENRHARQAGQLLRQQKPGWTPTEPERPEATDPQPPATALEQTEILHGNSDSASPSTLDRYQILAELGRGAMAVVHRARDEKLGRDVALKVLPLAGLTVDARGREIHQRFLQEAQAAARLRHPGIVTVYDVGEDGQRAWIAMDLIDGKDLSHWCQPERLMPLEQLLPLMVQVAQALDYAHRKGVVHRDIKPANMLYDQAAGQVVVTDFGVASLQDAAQTRTGTVLGSPSYMAPEQIRGKNVDGKADLYALGVSLYQLTTGRLPFQGDTLANVMYRITHEKFRPPSQWNPELPAAVEAVIVKAMQRQPTRRFSTGAEMAEALSRLIDDL